MEKYILVLLFFITITQFAAWGSQSVVYLLSIIFDVSEVTNTPLDIFAGVIAMIASCLMFAGAAMWWREITSAKSFLGIGAILFIVKNVVDIFNEIWSFSLAHDVVTMDLINILAKDIGSQFFQLAFWVFILFYFKYRIDKANETTPLPESPAYSN